MSKDNSKNLRNMTISMESGVDVKETKMLKGEAKDSLKGTNSTTQYETSGSGVSKPLGGENAGK